MCRCVVQGTDAIDVGGSGQQADPYIVDLEVSGDVGNALEVRDDGVWVGVEASSGVEATTGITGDGTAPNPLALDPPSAGIRRAASLSVLSNVSTAVPFDTIDHEISGELVDLVAQPTRLTIPVNGVYRIEAFVGWQGFIADDTSAAAAAERRLVSVALNGAGMSLPMQDFRHPIPTFQNSQDFMGGLFHTLARTRSLDAGQYLQVFVSQFNTGGVARTMFGAYLSATYIGPKT